MTLLNTLVGKAFGLPVATAKPKTQDARAATSNASVAQPGGSARPRAIALVRDSLELSGLDRQVTGAVSAADAGAAAAPTLADRLRASQAAAKAANEALFNASLTAEITSYYRESLHREPDAGGLAHYVAQAKAGRPLSEIENEIATSPEAQALQASQGGAATGTASATTGSASPATGTSATGSAGAVAPVRTDASELPAGLHHIAQRNPQGLDQAYVDATGGYLGDTFYPGVAQCGPTSLATVARAFGWGEGQTDAQLIMTLGGIIGTDPVNGTGAWAMAEGVNAYNASNPDSALPFDATWCPGADLATIDATLAAGGMVVANGNYNAIHGGSYDAGHFVAVVGKDADGNYLVMDPWSEGGPEVYTPEMMTTFIAEHRDPDGSFVALEPR